MSAVFPSRRKAFTIWAWTGAGVVIWCSFAVTLFPAGRLIWTSISRLSTENAYETITLPAVGNRSARVAVAPAVAAGAASISGISSASEIPRLPKMTRQEGRPPHHRNHQHKRQAAGAETAAPFFGVRPRVWTPPSWRSFPCFDPGRILRFHQSQSQQKQKGEEENMGAAGSSRSVAGKQQPVFPLKSMPYWRYPTKKQGRPRRGLLFVKPMKVGGSSATAINLRISKNMAERSQRRQRQQQSVQGEEEVAEVTAKNNHHTTHIYHDNIYTSGDNVVAAPASHGGRADGTSTQIPRNNSKSSTGPGTAEPVIPSFLMCENSYDHTNGRLHASRDLTRSFLWSLLRDPTNRAVSHFWHFHVSRRGMTPSLKNFRRVLSYYKNYYVHLHKLRNPPKGVVRHQGDNRNGTKEDEDAALRWIVQDVMDQYNFIGITERFDESMVVLKLLLDRSNGLNGNQSIGRNSKNDPNTNSRNDTSIPEQYVPAAVVVPLGDFLYLPTKVHGGYDNLCHFIQPSNVTPTMRAYLDGAKWERNSRYDWALYRAANASLDLTIDRLLGRDLVERTLRTYRQGLKAVHDRCHDLVRFGCHIANKDPSGKPRRRPPHETNCLFQDSACAYSCVDAVAEDLGLNSI
jgi:hypothetical protein